MAEVKVRASLIQDNSSRRDEKLLYELTKICDSRDLFQAQIRQKAAKKLWDLRKRLHARVDNLAIREMKRWQLGNIYELHEKYKQNLKASAEDCLTLVKKVAKAIISDHFECDQSTLKNKINSVIARLSNSKNITVYVNPREITELYDQLSKLNPLGSIDIQTCSDVRIGDAKVVSASGSVEISWNNHLDLLIDQLRNKLSIANDLRVYNE